MSALEIVMVSVVSVIAFILIFGFFVYRYYKKFVANRAKDFLFLDQYYKGDELLLLGDSLTNFFEVSQYFKDKNVCNRGIAGDTTLDVINRLDEILTLKPSKALLQIGINDVIYFRKLKHTDLVTRIIGIATKMRDNGTDVKIISLYPINRKKTKVTKLVCRNASNKKVLAINELLKAACEENNFEYINVHDHLTDEIGNLKKEYTIEGLHLSVQGYGVVYDCLKQYI